MSDNKSSNKRLSKNTIFLSVRMVIVLLISFYTTRIVLQELGVMDYGIYNVVCGFIAMFTFFNTSMSNGIQRFFNYEYGQNGEEGANRVYCTSVYIQTLLAIVIVLLIEVFGLWYLHNKIVIPEDRMLAAEWIFQLAILMFVIGIIQAPYTAAVVAHEKFDFYAIVSVIDAILKLVIVFLLKAVSADKLIIYGIFSTSVVVLNIIVYYVYCKINFPEITFRHGINRNLLKKMLSFSGWNLFGSLSGVMEGQGINLVVNLFYGPVVNAARGVANQINGGVQAFVLNITMPVRPQVTQSFARGEIHRMLSLTYGVSKLSSAIILMLAIPASIEINYLLQIWLGENVPDHTSTFTILILITTLVNNLNAAISNVVHATGMMRNYQLYGSIVRICSVPIAFFLVKFYDVPEFALLAVFMMASSTHFVCLIIAKHLVPFSLRDYSIKVILTTVIVLLISVTIVYPIHIMLPEGFMRFVLVGIVSVLSVCLSCFYVALNESERQLVFQLLKPALILFRLKY